MTVPRVLCKAVVDPVSGHDPLTWVVTVTGEPPYGETRTYQIAGTDGEAAMQGIDRFVEEMTARGVGS